MIVGAKIAKLNRTTKKICFILFHILQMKQDETKKAPKNAVFYIFSYLCIQIITSLYQYEPLL